MYVIALVLLCYDDLFSYCLKCAISHDPEWRLKVISATGSFAGLTSGKKHKTWLAVLLRQSFTAFADSN